MMDGTRTPEAEYTNVAFDASRGDFYLQEMINGTESQVWSGQFVVDGRPVLRVSHYPFTPTQPASEPPFVPTRDTFERLAREWQDETAHESRIRAMVLHPAYQRIIGMGGRAVPWIIHQMEEEPAYWFAALEAITGENPVPSEDAGNLRAQTDAWLNWGRQHGLLEA